MKRSLLALCVLILSHTVFADECENASTQSQLNICTAGQYQSAEKKLNQTFHEALTRSSPPQAALLEKAQQTWVPLRDSDCAFVSSGVVSGSLQPMVKNQCLMDKTIEREAWIASLLQCEEGDLSCPLPRGN